jgi:nitric oxide reductase NorD protein
VFQRERHGTLLVDHERRFDLYLRALWHDSAQLVPYATGLDPATIPQAECVYPLLYYDADRDSPARRPRRRARRQPGSTATARALAHIAGHRRWSTADVRRQFQPDAAPGDRVLRRQPHRGADPAPISRPARHFLALHPQPVEGACNPATHSCLRHRLAMLSRALLDPEHGYQDACLREFVERFAADDGAGRFEQRRVATLALAYVARTRRQSDQLASVYFADTEIGYRDDNRHLWRFHELSDDEEMFDAASDDRRGRVDRLPPRHYPEWDYQSQTYRPDWVSLYESLHPAGERRAHRSPARKARRAGAASEAPARSPASRRTGCASATRKTAANSTSTSPSAR